MAALTCIPNFNANITEPLEREYILFYLNSDNKVAWEIRNPDGSPGKRHNPTKHAPVFKNPSSFASIYHEQLVFQTPPFKNPKASFFDSYKQTTSANEVTFFN